eukprot:3786291-Prymnesium_polylepis.1
MEPMQASSASSDEPLTAPEASTAMVETDNPEPTAEQADIQQMMELATKHGYVCRSSNQLTQEVAEAIAAKIIQHTGDRVYP